MAVFWLILLVCLLALCQIAVYARLGLKKVSYKRFFEQKRVFAGDTVRLIEIVENDKLLPLPWLRIESAASPWLSFGNQENLEVSSQRFLKSVFFLGSFKRIKRRHEVSASRRGWYDCSLASMTAGDLLGLANCSKDCDTHAQLLVYPRIAAPEELPPQALRWQGEVSVRRWTDPDPLLSTGLREYRPGDSRRDVNWRATARMDELYINQRDYTVEPRLLIMLNTQIRADLWGGMEPQEAEFIEKGVSLCARLAYWGSSQGMSAGLRANASSSIPGAGPELISVEPGSAGLEAVLEALAVLKIEMRISYAALLDREIEKRPEGLDILCVSAYWDSELEGRATALRKLGNSVSYIPMGGVEA